MSHEVWIPAVHRDLTDNMETVKLDWRMARAWLMRELSTTTGPHAQPH